MVKQESSTPGVYLVGPAGGNLRPWCGKCHKFLKSENAPHDCTPVNLSSHRGKKTSNGKRKRIRLTDKTRAKLAKVFQAAVFGDAALRAFRKLKSIPTNKTVTGKRISKTLDKVMKKSDDKRLNRLIRKFL